MWDPSLAITGFRIYQRECSGMPTGTPIEVTAADRQFGPLQPCRLGGNIGVSAVSGVGELPIT